MIPAPVPCVKPAVKLLIAVCVLFLAACGSTGTGMGCPAVPQDQAARPAGCLGYSITPDARSYSTQVSKITFTVTATNVSAQSCAGPFNLVCGGPALRVTDAAGRAVWTRTPPAVACPLLVRLLPPGESMSAKVDWQPQSLATGAYSVQASSGPDLGRSYFLVC